MRGTPRMSNFKILSIFSGSCTVIIFLARTGQIRAVKFRPKNFGRISFDLGEISLIQQILRLSNGRNSPKLGDIRPKFLRANLNCVDLPISNKFRPKKNYCVDPNMVTKNATRFVLRGNLLNKTQGFYLS
jgi:hypothetical protein